jgi:hypothetical protein
MSSVLNASTISDVAATDAGFLFSKWYAPHFEKFGRDIPSDITQLAADAIADETLKAALKLKKSGAKPKLCRKYILAVHADLRRRLLSSLS